MTATLRLYIAAALCALAAPLGLLLAGAGEAPTVAATARGWSPESASGAADINAYVERIAAAGLLPEAELRPANAEFEAVVNPNTVDELAAVVANPDLAALVREDGAWRLLIYGQESAADVFVVGDRLEDGWEITEIGAAHVTLSYDGRSRRIDVFNTVEPED